MKCYICKSDTPEPENSIGDYRHIGCTSCGEYNISGTAVTESESRAVDAEAMQQLLKERRKATSDTPRITSIEMVYAST